MRLTGFDWCEGSRITSHDGISLWFSGHDLCTHWYFAREWSRSLMNFGGRMEFVVCKRESAVHCMSITSTVQHWFIDISPSISLKKSGSLIQHLPYISGCVYFCCFVVFDISVKSRCAVVCFFFSSLQYWKMWNIVVQWNRGHKKNIYTDYPCRPFRTTCPDWVSQRNEDMRCRALYLIRMPLSAVRLHGPRKSNTFCDLAAGLKVDLPNSV